MNELLEFYQQQARANLSTIPWLAELQQKGLKYLAQGFPTRTDEEWKYTNVEKLLEKRFLPSIGDSSNQEVAALNYTFPLTQQLMIYNGEVSDTSSLNQSLPSGAWIQPLSYALTHSAEQVKPYLGQLLELNHGFQALNTALLDSGVVIYIPADVSIEEPIVLSHYQDKENQAVHMRYLVIAEKNSQVTIVEDYSGCLSCSYLTNVVTEVFLKSRANVTHYKIQREDKEAYHIGHLAVRQSAESQFSTHSLNLGGKLVRSDLNIELREANARCLMNGIYLPAEGQHIDQHTLVSHEVPCCESEQDYKGILMGRSRAVFNGKVYVAKDAQHTKAKQQNKNLLLSSLAEIDTKPQLEIFADDVVCSHGATVGQLDDEALFYLSTRGIDKNEASHYLIQAFTADNLRLIPHRVLAEWVSNLLNQQLGMML